MRCISDHLIYRLSTDQILVTEDYQSVPLPEVLIEAISETYSYDNKFQVNNLGMNHSTIHDDQSDNNNDNGRTHFNDEDNSEDESYDELDNEQQLNGMKSNEIVDQENQNILIMGSYKSTSASVKHTGTTSTHTFLQCLFLQYLHKAVITILCLQPSLTVSVHKRYSTPSLRRHLHGCIFTIISTSISKE